MKKNLILFLTILPLFSCSNNIEENHSEVKIRLSNVSQYHFQNILVNTNSGNVNFGNLFSGNKSEYKVFDIAYRYAFVELEIAGETYTLQPIDYVGENPLENGYYTYQLDVNDTGGQFTRLSLTLVED